MQAGALGGSPRAAVAVLHAYRTHDDAALQGVPVATARHLHVDSHVGAGGRCEGELELVFFALGQANAALVLGGLATLLRGPEELY